MTHASFDSTALNHLFKPRTIAVVGASDDPGRIGGRPIRILQNSRFSGSIYPVNPKYPSVFGIDCYPDIAELPEDVDLYIFCIQAAATVKAFERAAARGAKAAVVFGGGFAEVGAAGHALQQRLQQLASARDIPICGPNTLGYASFANATFGTFATALEAIDDLTPGTIALLSQSGGTAFNLFVEARSAGARFSHVVATGNEVNVSFPDYLSYFAQDPSTSAVVGYMEGLGDGGRLTHALQAAREIDMPVFLLKAGATERGALAAQSHTAQISGNDAAFEAAFSRYGVTRLSTFSDVVDVCRAIAIPRIEQGIAIATNSGGAAVYLSDLCERHGVPLAPLSEATRAELLEKLPPFAGLTNPIDFTAQVLNDPGLLATTIDVLDKDESVEAIIVFLGSMQSLADSLIETIRMARAQCRKPLLLTWMGVKNEVRARAEAAGLVVCDDPARVLSGIGMVRRNHLNRARAVGHMVPAAVAGPADAVIRYVDEYTLKERLRGHGIGTPRGELVADADEALRAAGRVGYPCVAKVVRPVVPHKTDAGAIRLGIGTAAEMRSAFEALQASTPGAERFLIEAQVAAGPEVITGVLQDQTFGTRAVLGLGGVDVGEGRDAVTLVPPYTPTYVLDEMRRLGIDAPLERSGADVVVAAEQLSRLLEAACSILGDPRCELHELECNPVVFLDGRVVVLDALALRSGPADSGRS